ncbi:MAG: NAD(P)-dependent oxidoreductase, partial [Candidatus Omnitrophota bacterium]|nr:NAD(P)-dependent oxidoreductase [Candidatus Omnitrophota bacterium]
MKRLLIKIISLLSLLVFSSNTCSYGLATLPASQNSLAKREILSALQRTQIRYAESDDAIRLLDANNASCLLLSSGKYLVTKEVAEDDLKLLRAIGHEDIEAIMQILAKEDRYKYQGIKELVLKYYAPDKNSYLPVDLYVNHTVAKAFEWLILVRQGIILREEIPEETRIFLKDIEPIINSSRHNYFTEEFWESDSRSNRIRQALSKGFVFYQTAGRFKNPTVHSADKNTTNPSAGALKINFPKEIRMFASGKNIGITGASGGIGSALVRRLIKENPEIRLNVLMRKMARQRPAWDDLLKRFPKNINIIEGDLMEIEALRRLVRESDAIFHIALDSRDDFRSQEPGGDDKSRGILISNTVPGAIMSTLAAENNKPFIFASSYGIFFHIMKSAKGQKLKEEDVLIDDGLKKNVEEFVGVLQRSCPLLLKDRPTSARVMLAGVDSYLRKTKLFSDLSNHQLYAVQKLINELIIKRYPYAAALRIGNIYGPGDAEGRPMPGLIKKVMAGGKQLISNDRRSYIYVDDVAEAFLRAAVISQKGLLSESDRVISVAYPEVTDSLSVAEKVKDVLGVKTEFEIEGDQINENLELDLSRMKLILGMPRSQLVPLEEGILRTVKSQQETSFPALSDLQFKDLDEAIEWVKNEFIPMQNMYRRLKKGRRLAEEHLRAFTAITNIILGQTGYGEKVAIMTYGSSAGKFMTENADTDFCILSDGAVSDTDLLRLQVEIEKGLKSIPSYPWRVSFKSWELAREGMLDLSCARFVCGNRDIYDRHITHSPRALQIINDKDNIISAIARRDLYIDYISSPAFSQRLRRFLTQEEFPEDIQYGNVKFYRGGLRTAHTILMAANLYSDSDEQFIEKADIESLITKGIISEKDAEKFYKALDFLLTAKDISRHGYNIFNKENIRSLSTIWGENEDEIRKQYDESADNLTYIMDKIRGAVQQANSSNIGVVARLSNDRKELERIVDTGSV